MSTLRQNYEFYANDIDQLYAQGNQVVQLSEEKLPEAQATQASTYSYWSALYALAQHEADKSEHLAQKNILSDCMIRARDKILADKGEKASDARAKEVALVDPMYTRAVAQFHKADLVAKMFRGICEALSQRDEMIKSINSRLNREKGFYTNT